jgi:hypothetical protein
LARVSGAYVVLYQGGLAGYLQRAGGALTTFSREPSAARDRAVAQALAGWARAQPLRRAFQLATIDGAAAANHALSAAFREVGFVAAGGGLLLSLRDRDAFPEPEPEPEPDAESDADLDEADAGG